MPTTTDHYTAARNDDLAAAASGLNLNDSEDRVIFRTRMESRWTNLAMGPLADYAQREGIPASDLGLPRSRASVVRAIADAYIGWMAYGPEDVGCECEQDWNCPLHQNRVGTWIETRYDHLDDGERF